MKKLRIVLIKPSKYARDGLVERFEKGFMPNASLYHIRSLTPPEIDGRQIEVHCIDEYVKTDLDYLRLLHQEPDSETLVALVGVQSHQFHRALDLTAYALEHGVRHCVIGGPHVMTCDTSLLHNRGVSFALAEAEMIWEDIISDAVAGELKAVYSTGIRWQKTLKESMVLPPSPAELQQYVLPMLGLYPVRGCPYKCNYCSVIKISGNNVRSISTGTTIDNMRRARDAGVEYIVFVSDNFNKYPDVEALLEAIIDANLGLKFLCQCDTHVVNQPELFELLQRAGCFEMFIGVESFNRDTLKAVNKHHNRPKKYGDLISLCQDHGIRAHFSNIIGFPEDTESSILESLEILKSLKPDVVSFYILTPIPGTEQYDDYLTQGLITETNLDRFDTTCSVWRHPSIEPERLEELLYHSYVDYYRYLMRDKNRYDEFPEFATFCRFVASMGIHPMAGGAGRIEKDKVADYMALRQQRFEITHAPLPTSLKLSAEDEAFNANMTWGKTKKVKVD